MIGMPHYRDKLLSAWGNDRIFEVGQPPVASIEIPSGARRGPGNIGHIFPNTRKGFRNQVSSTISSSPDKDSAVAPKYLSDKTRNATNGGRHEDDVADVTGAFARFALTNSTGEAPHGYEELRIRYGGPRGVQDFDFGYV